MQLTIASLEWTYMIFMVGTFCDIYIKKVVKDHISALQFCDEHVSRAKGFSCHVCFQNMLLWVGVLIG